MAGEGDGVTLKPAPPIAPYRPELDQLPYADQQPTRVEAPTGWAYLDYFGADILMHAQTPVELDWRLRACRKEPWTVDWIEALTTEDRLFNVGANVGSYALIAASLKIPTVAFEPGFHNYQALCLNTLANSLGQYLVSLPFALGDKTRWQVFGYGDVQAGAASLIPNKAGACGALRQLTFTMDDSVKSLGLGQPTAFLIDVDGAEVGVLKGAAETLKTVRTVLIELDKDPAIAEPCEAMLRAAGLELTERIDRDTERFDRMTYGIWHRGH